MIATPVRRAPLPLLVLALGSFASPAAPVESGAETCVRLDVETISALDHEVRIVRSAPASVELVAAHTIDADGDPRAYHPDDTGLDSLVHAGAPGSWWALVTDDGTPAGAPIVQGEGDPAPGYYVSATTLADESKDRRDPRRYVDAGAVPYVVLPRSFADVGPEGRIGEGSIAFAARLGLPASPRPTRLHVPSLHRGGGPQA